MAAVKTVKLSRHAVLSLRAADGRTREHLKEAIRHLASAPSLGKDVHIGPRGLRSYETGGYCILHRLRRGAIEIVSIYRRPTLFS